ncbi:amino acid permease [Lactobacillus sp. ESL0731]|uniref:APC family permease n=1 Tax=unclassified Lactobacillus TaxID=2620435 RepID=UPI0023F9D949|nr:MULTISPECIES: amino acid permease [unclassified Lactobacillus]WEV50799.1 amino acid permease [Lactobacillus sp. ESL0700]WEV61930.1 amino acid permease [Lactobacillus sp. ESL0731]
MKRQLTLFAALATVMGTMIGGGAFFKIASVSALTHNAWLSILVWPLAGFITLMAGLSVAELAAIFPEDGGPVKYLQEIYGSKIAFLFGWSLIIVYYPANIAALSIVFATQLKQIPNFSSYSTTGVALIGMLVILLVNWLGSKLSSEVQKLALIIKLLPIAAIIIFAIFNSSTNQLTGAPLPHLNSANGAAFGQALLAVLFAYDGWLSIGNLAGEIKNPAKTLSRAITWGVFGVTIIYTLLNWSYTRMIPWSTIVGNQGTALLTAQRLFGNLGGLIISIGILVSVFGAINGHLMVGSRMPYTLGKQQKLPAANFFAKLNRKTVVPTNSMLFECAIAAVMIFSGTFDSLTDMLVYVSWIFSILLFVGVFILRKRKSELIRPYKVPLFPWPPILAIIGALFIVINTTLTQPFLALIGILLTLSGWPVYIWTQKK